MTFPFVSALTAGIIIILQQALMLNVGLYRGRVGVGVGHGGEQTLERRMRRHGNLAENAGLFIASLALAELSGASQPIILGCASVFVFARILHAVAFSSATASHLSDGGKLFLRMRMLGATLTALVGLTLGGCLIYMASSTL